MPASPYAYYPGSTMAVILPLSNLSGSALTGAAVTMTMQRVDETTVDGQSWPADLSEVDGSPGWYQGTLEPDLDVEVGERLVLVVEADTSAGLARWTVTVPVLLRSA